MVTIGCMLCGSFFANKLGVAFDDRDANKIFVFNNQQSVDYSLSMEGESTTRLDIKDQTFFELTEIVIKIIDVDVSYSFIRSLFHFLNTAHSSVIIMNASAAPGAKALQRISASIIDDGKMQKLVKHSHGFSNKVIQEICASVASVVIYGECGYHSSFWRCDTLFFSHY